MNQDSFHNSNNILNEMKFGKGIEKQNQQEDYLYSEDCVSQIQADKSKSFPEDETSSNTNDKNPATIIIPSFPQRTQFPGSNSGNHETLKLNEYIGNDEKDKNQLNHASEEGASSYSDKISTGSSDSKKSNQDFSSHSFTKSSSKLEESSYATEDTGIKKDSLRVKQTDTENKNQTQVRKNPFINLANLMLILENQVKSKLLPI